jgi:hypothetical protein
MQPESQDETDTTIAALKQALGQRLVAMRRSLDEEMCDSPYQCAVIGELQARVEVVASELGDLRQDSESIARLESAILGRTQVIDRSRLGRTVDCPITAIAQFAGLPSGSYFVDLGFLPRAQFVFDLSVPGEIWIRLNHKIGNSFYGTPGCTWTEDSVAAVLPHVKHFGVSNDPATMHTEYSWYILSPRITAGRTLDYGHYDMSVPMLLYLVNVLNGLTPTGTSWYSEYSEGYVWFAGVFRTFGQWTSMYEGCNYTSHIAVGTETSFRTGGHLHHTGEYIHSSCNGYASKDHSITSRVCWMDNRFFWFRID